MFVKQNFKSSTMKLLLATAALCFSLSHAYSSEDKNIRTEKIDISKEATTDKKKEEKKPAENKNIHSIKQWKITIEYTNGSIISKTISVDNSSGRSALDAAFDEADKYLRNIKIVKEYNISPVSKSNILLAGD